MARTAGSKNRSHAERKAAALAEFLRLDAVEQAEKHPWLGAFASVVNALEAAVGDKGPDDIPEALADVANTLRAVLATIRTVGREHELDAVRSVLGGEVIVPDALKAVLGLDDATDGE